MHPSAERLVRQEVSKARGQAQLLDDKLKLVPAWSLDDGAARTLVDDAAKIITTFTNVIACLSSPPVSVSCPAALDLDSNVNSSHDQSREAAVAASTSDTSRSDEDRAPAKKRKINHQQQQQQPQHSTDQETVPDDGYTWRKYGQKDILGSRHPKSYYRCTHKRESGCPAIKYVQRSDSNPSSFRITYRGEHTCSFSGHGALPRKSPGLSSSPTSSPAPPIINLNSVCLRINSDGGLQLGASGPTVIPTAPMQQQQQTLQAPISVPEDLPAAPPPPGSSSGDLEAEDGERQDHRDQLIHEIDVAIAAAGDVSGGVSLESFFLEFGSSLMDGFEQNCPLFTSDRSSSEWSDCIAY